MKRYIKLISVFLSALILASALSSCQLSEIFGGDEDTTTAASADTTTAASGNTETDIPEYDAMDFLTENDPLEYIILGQYRGLEATVKSVSVSDEEYETEIQNLLNESKYYEQITDRVTAAGDTLNIDFKGTINGEEFSGNKATGATISLTENTGYVPGFDKDLYGIMPGTTVNTTFNFPDNYYEEVAGKEVTFEIKVNYIQGEQITPTLDVDFITKFTNGDYTDLDAFAEFFRGKLLLAKKQSAESDAKSALWQTVLDGCTVKTYPEQQVNYYFSLMKKQYVNYAASYSVDYETILSYMGTSEAKMKEEAELYTKEDLAFYAIVRAENLNVSDEEYNEKVSSYAANAGATFEEFENYYGKQYLLDNILWDKMVNSVFEWAVITNE